MLRNARGGVYAQALRGGGGGVFTQALRNINFLFLANNFGLPACPNSKPIITTQ